MSETNLSDHDLLVEIAENTAKMQKQKKIIAITLIVIAAVIVIACILTLPRLLQLLNNANEVTQKVNALDFDSLNQAVKDLQKAVSSLTSALNIFH